MIYFSATKAACKTKSPIGYKKLAFVNAEVTIQVRDVVFLTMVMSLTEVGFVSLRVASARDGQAL